MCFEYEITADGYAAAQSLYYRMCGDRKHIQMQIGWILAGSFFIVVAWNERPFDWAEFLLAAVGAWWIYAGIVNLFLPARHFRRAYAASELAGKKFKVDVNEDGFDVAGDTCSWRVKWQGVRFKGENERVFMFYSYGTVFMFGKQYLTNEQQRELRSLSGLSDCTL